MIHLLRPALFTISHGLQWPWRRGKVDRSAADASLALVGGSEALRSLIAAQASTPFRAFSSFVLTGATPAFCLG